MAMSSTPQIGENDVLFRCRRCGKSLVIDQRAVGLEVTCPDCRSPITVPDKETATREYDELAKLRSSAAPGVGGKIQEPKADHTARQPEPDHVPAEPPPAAAPSGPPAAEPPPPPAETPAASQPETAPASVASSPPEPVPAAQEELEDEVRIEQDDVETGHERQAPSPPPAAAPPPDRRATVAAAAMAGLPPAEVLQEALNAAHRRVSVLAKSLLDMKQRRKRLETFRARTLVTFETVREEVQSQRDSLDRILEALDSALKDPFPADGVGGSNPTKSD